jgi:hypothetical protein
MCNILGFKFQPGLGLLHTSFFCTHFLALTFADHT